MAYWVALALHLGAPQPRDYAKIAILKSPAWLSAPETYAKLASLKVPEWFACAEVQNPPHTSHGTRSLVPYEKLSALKAY